MVVFLFSIVLEFDFASVKFIFNVSTSLIVKHKKKIIIIILIAFNVVFEIFFLTSENLKIQHFKL